MFTMIFIPSVSLRAEQAGIKWPSLLGLLAILKNSVHVLSIRIHIHIFIYFSNTNPSPNPHSNLILIL